jgi:mRNA-degrading endonuclease toxin of MazEF toxin-antitoxin module
LAQLNPNLQFGAIIWAVLKDHNGFRKRRPAIVLTPNDEIEENTPLVVMCITSSFTNPPPEDHLFLPWNPDPRRVETRLAKRSAAVVSWLDTLYPDEVLEVKGRISSIVMEEIRKRLRARE